MVNKRRLFLLSGGVNFLHTLVSILEEAHLLSPFSVRTLLRALGTRIQPTSVERLASA